MIAHPDDRAIELFALGALEGRDEEVFIAHVSACDACSAKLQREAALELACIELQGQTHDDRCDPAAEAVPTLAPKRTRGANRYLAPAVIVLAAAAAIALFVRRDRPRAEATAQAVALCPEGPGQLACITEAFRARRTVEHAPGSGIVAGPSGLTVDVRFEVPDPPIDEFEQVAASVRRPIADCIGAALNVQTSMRMSGAFDIRSEIAPDGTVASATTVIQLKGNGKPPVRDNRALAGCVEAAWKGLRFRRAEGEQTRSRVVTNVSFLWSE